MALLTCQYKNKRIGFVRNHKAGSTTVMSLLSQMIHSEPARTIHSYRTWIDQNGEGSYIHKHDDYTHYIEQLESCDIRIAVWRNPIKKFLSGYYHTMFSPTGAQDNLWRGPKTLNNFLDDYEYYITNQNVLDHCVTNTRKLGDSKHVYSCVVPIFAIVRIKELLESICMKPLEMVRLRNQSLDYDDISNDQKDRIVKIMEQDFDNGWR